MKNGLDDRPGDAAGDAEGPEREEDRPEYGNCGEGFRAKSYLRPWIGSTFSHGCDLLIRPAVAAQLEAVLMEGRSILGRFTAMRAKMRPSANSPHDKKDDDWKCNQPNDQIDGHRFSLSNWRRGIGEPLYYGSNDTPVPFAL